jgi:NADH-quinone oxidoreductase subunit G
VLRALARFIAASTGCHYDEIPAGANAAGLARAGVLPAGNGLHVGAMLARPRKALLLHHVEGPIDFADGTAAAGALRQSQFTVALSAFDSTALRQYAHAILPVALPPEGEGSYANVDGTLQAVVAAAKAPGEARPAWRVLRALGGALGLPGFDFTEFAALRAAATAGAAPACGSGLSRRDAPTGMTRIATLPMFRVDPVVRRAAALQATVHALPARVVLHPGDALALGLGAGARAIVADGSLELALPVETSTAVPHGGAWIEAGHAETALLAPAGAPLTVRKA